MKQQDLAEKRFAIVKGPLQRQITGRTLLELFASYTVVRLQFADGSRLWTYPELTSFQADVLERLRFTAPQTTLMLS